jgi:hypothetical protein
MSGLLRRFRLRSLSNRRISRSSPRRRGARSRQETSAAVSAGVSMETAGTDASAGSPMSCADCSAAVAILSFASIHCRSPRISSADLLPGANSLTPETGAQRVLMIVAHHDERLCEDVCEFAGGFIAQFSRGVADALAADRGLVQHEGKRCSSRAPRRASSGALDIGDSDALSPALPVRRRALRVGLDEAERETDRKRFLPEPPFWVANRIVCIVDPLDRFSGCLRLRHANVHRVRCRAILAQDVPSPIQRRQRDRGCPNQ